MAGDVRERMVTSAVRLLATRGLAGASFADVLDAAAAPRGSIYHHFPQGKDQLVAEAVDRAGGHALAQLDGLRGRPADVVVGAYLEMWRQILVRTELRAGCAVLAVTVDTDSGDLLGHAEQVFTAWRGQLADLLRAGGIDDPAAASWATMLVAATEGGVVLARAERRIAPFELVARELLAGTRQRLA